MAKVLYFSDPHMSDHNPASRIDNYSEAIFKKLEQIGGVCKKLKVDLVLCAGDWFGTKTATRNSHRLIRRSIATFKDFGCDVVGILGNHDISWARLDSIEKQPIGVLEASGAITLVNSLEGKEYVKQIGSLTIRVGGIPYQTELNLEEAKKCLGRKGADFCFNLFHCSAARTAGNMFSERIFGYPEFLDIDTDVFMFGHWHKYQGVEKLEHEGKEKYFVNIGALSRGSLTEEELERLPKIVLFDLAPGKIDYKIANLKCTPSEECFSVERKARLDQREDEVARFVEGLATEQGSGEKVNLDNMVREMDVQIEVKERVLEYLELARKEE